SGRWCSSVQSIHFLTLATSAASLVRYASGTRPSRKYGPRSHPSPLPPSQALCGPRSPQNSSRCPLSPCACKRNCSSSQPFGITLPSGRALNALGSRGLRLATGALAACAPRVATAASTNIGNRDRMFIHFSVPISKPERKQTGGTDDRRLSSVNRRALASFDGPRKATACPIQYIHIRHPWYSANQAKPCRKRQFTARCEVPPHDGERRGID